MVAIANGLCILGTEARCGKTVFMAAFASVLKEQGFIVRALKPVATGNRPEWEAEQHFIADFSNRAPKNPDAILVDHSFLNVAQWQQVSATRSESEQFTIIEMPAGCATPLFFAGGDDGDGGSSWYDSIDLIEKFELPCVLVGNHSFEALEKLRLCSTFIRSRGVDLVGVVTVETTAGGGSRLERRLERSEVELALRDTTGVDYLGCIKHSPSISVPNQSLGDLVQMAAGGLDLLNLLKALDLAVPSLSS